MGQIKSVALNFTNAIINAESAEQEFAMEICGKVDTLVRNAKNSDA